MNEFVAIVGTVVLVAVVHAGSLSDPHNERVTHFNPF